MSFNTSKTRTARKPHVCDFCFGPVGPGMRYNDCRGVEDGRWGRTVLHVPCTAALREQDDYYDGWYNVHEIGMGDALVDFGKAGVLDEALPYLPIKPDDEYAWKVVLERTAMQVWRDHATAMLANVEAA